MGARIEAAGCTHCGDLSLGSVSPGIGLTTRPRPRRQITRDRPSGYEGRVSPGKLRPPLPLSQENPERA